MAININIKIKHKRLPDNPGVYFMNDARGRIIYIGKAASLKRRVSSYFAKRLDVKTAEMVSKIAAIDYLETPSVLEALVLEANQIKKHKPFYNILAKDDRSFPYLIITKEDFPKPLIMRGHELEQIGVNPFSAKLSGRAKNEFLAVFGPYTSARSLNTALDLVRRAIPWSTCDVHVEGKKIKACFDNQIGRCPGVCAGAISKTDYRKIIRQLILFFQGRTGAIKRQLRAQMESASEKREFEKAMSLRNKLYALEHIQDVALITRDESRIEFAKGEQLIDLNSRIETYDISTISGTSAVGSMVVFEDGRPNKSEYRKFKIKTVRGTNDVAMLEEVLRRRLAHKSWPLPELIVVDGGEGHVNRAQRVLYEYKINIPVIGIAKGFDRKQDRFVYDKSNMEIARVAERGKELFQRARDEAHRFAIKYHRQVRGRKMYSSD
ncbi:MAG: Excinuclease ABC subunit C [uncultured bacterium]|nr:MAG: Excinuclease ABC subunit C [uncultured bacterium]HBD04949.1 hypothetical protein [Candidatus Uhrbacteria bacterium]